MNKIFKKIWNKKLACVVVVAENTCHQQKSGGVTGVVTSPRLYVDDAEAHRHTHAHTFVLSILVLGMFGCISMASHAGNTQCSGGRSSEGYDLIIPDTTGDAVDSTFACGIYSNAYGDSAVAMGTRSSSTRYPSAAKLTKVSDIYVSVNGIGIRINETVGEVTWDMLKANNGALIRDVNGLNLDANQKRRFFETIEYFGNLAMATNSIAIGVGNVASTTSGIYGGSSSAIGQFNQATASYTLAAGYSNIASGANSSAVGSSNTASGYSSSALGSSNRASGYYSVAVGVENISLGRFSTAFGYNNRASNRASNAMGTGNVASGILSTAVGTGHTPATFSKVDDYNYESNGVKIRTTGGLTATNITHVDGRRISSLESEIIYNTFTGGSSSTQLNIASGPLSNSFGYHNTASGTLSMAMGAKNSSSGVMSTTVGNNNTASGLRSSVFGSESRATAENATALGHNSLADEANTISVGKTGAEKRITHVADPTKATDAVNKRYVDQFANAAALAVQYDSALQDQVTLEGISGTTITNLKAGVADEDAVNVAQLKQKADLSVVDQLDQRVDDLDDDVGGLAGRVGVNETNIDDLQVHLGTAQSQINSNRQALVSSLGAGANFQNGVFTAPTYVIQNQSYRDVGQAFTAVNNKLTNLDQRMQVVETQGTGSGGINGKSAYQIAQDNGFQGTVTEWLGSLVGDKGDKGDTGAAGRDGVDGKDGLNGLDGKDGAKGDKGDTGATGRDGVDGKDGLNGLDGKDGAKGDKGDTGAAGRDGVDGKDGLNGLDGKDGAKGDKGDTGAAGRDGVDGKDGLNGLDGKDGAKGDKGDTGAAGRDGVDGKDGLNGLDGKDGAKGDKGDTGLSAYEVAVKNGYTGTETDWLVSQTNPYISMSGSASGHAQSHANGGIGIGENSQAGEQSVAIGQDTRVTGHQSTAVGKGNHVSGNRSGAFGDPNQVSGNESYVMGNDNTITGDQTFVLGNNVNSDANNAVILGHNSTSNRDHTVSVGSTQQQRQIIHVAAGVEDTDAVNVAQMHSADEAILKQSTTYTDTRVQALESSFKEHRLSVDRRFKDMNDQIDRQGAMNAAMMNMANSTAGVQGPNRLGVGTGFQGGERAIAIGYQRVVNANTTLSIGGAFTENEKSGGLGVGFGW